MKLVIRIEAGEDNALTPEFVDIFNAIEKEIFSEYIIDSNLTALIEAQTQAHIDDGVLNIR